MGNAAAARHRKKRVVFIPAGERLRHQTVVSAVEILPQRLGKIQRKFAAGGMIKIGGNTLIIHPLGVRRRFVEPVAALGGQLAHRRHKIGAGIPLFLQRRLIG